MDLPLDEQETIITFNKGERTAYIFTYEKTWQKQLEQKLGLKPIWTNGLGGKEYEIDKKRIPMPRAPRQLTAEQKKQAAERLAGMRQKSILSRKTQSRITKSDTKKKKVRNTIAEPTRGKMICGFPRKDWQR